MTNVQKPEYDPLSDPNTYAGFVAGFQSQFKRNPTEQEIFSAGRRSGIKGAQAFELRNGQLKAALQDMLAFVDEPPPANCSCHIVAPCNDCEYSHQRSVLENVRSLLGSEI